MRAPRLILSDLAFAVLLWALMIAKYGYTYGSLDHEEILVYVQFLKNPALYAHDFFVQGLNGSLPNERIVMAYILLPFASHLGITVFLFHFFNTILMILGFVKAAGLFIRNRYGVWMAVFISFFILYNRALGGVDEYSAAFQTGDLSGMVCTWALLFFIEGRYTLSTVVMSVATFIHVLVGFDLMAVMCGVMLWKYFIDKKIDLKELIRFFGIYIFTAGIYLVLVYRAKAAGNGTISNGELFDIMFAFRHPHHFIFSVFPAITKVLFLIYTAAALIYFKVRSRTIFQFVVLGTVVLFFYIIIVDYGHVVFIASFQWYKVTPWIKFFGSIAITAYILKAAGQFLPNENKIINSCIILSGLVTGVTMFYFYLHGDIAHGYKQYNEDEIKLSIKLKEMVPTDAVFIQPFGITAMKFYAQRSSYIDFKAIAKNQKDVKEWYRRIQEVYGLDFHMKEKGFALEARADTYFNALSEDQLARLHAEGVTHIIARSDKYSACHKLILSENGYFVYQL